MSLDWNFPYQLVVSRTIVYGARETGYNDAHVLQELIGQLIKVQKPAPRQGASLSVLANRPLLSVRAQ